jgi:hypothetical protein
MMTPQRCVRRRPTGQPQRQSAAVLLMVYALTVWALPFAHAVLLDGAAGPAAHLESQGTQDHREAHDAFDCTIFSAARLLAAEARPAPTLDGVSDVAAVRPVVSAGPRLGPARGAHGSRAPPFA